MEGVESRAITALLELMIIDQGSGCIWLNSYVIFLLVIFDAVLTVLWLCVLRLTNCSVIHQRSVSCYQFLLSSQID